MKILFPEILYGIVSIIIASVLCYVLINFIDFFPTIIFVVMNLLILIFFSFGICMLIMEIERIKTKKV